MRRLWRKQNRRSVPKLASEGRLAPHEVEYVDRQQGWRCLSCGGNLRSIVLARAISRPLGLTGPLKESIAGATHQRVLEHVGCNSEAYCTECYPAETSATSIAPISSAKFHAAQYAYAIAPYGLCTVLPPTPDNRAISWWGSPWLFSHSTSILRRTCGWGRC